MPIRFVSLIVVLIALAAAIYAAVLGNLQAPTLTKSIHMYGGVRTQSDISTDALEAIASPKDSSDNPRVHLVVQFERLLTPAEQNKLELRFHIDIQEAIPVSAYVVSLPAKRALNILNELEHMTPASRGVVDIRPSDKLSPALGKPGQLVIPEHAEKAYGPGISQQDGVAVLLFLFSDTTVDDISDMLENIRIRSLYDSVHGASTAPGARHGLSGPYPLIIAREDIGKLLESEHVRWIEPVPAPAEDDLGRLQNRSQAPLSRRVVQPGAREIAGHTAPAGGGAGVLIAQFESCQPRFRQPNAHPALINRPALPPRRIVHGNQIPQKCEPPKQNTLERTQGPPEHPGSHATMVAGIMIGTPVTGPYV
ncbi:MAG: hypothetical protein WBN41_02445, partial [Lysobacterales bacterium]